MLSRAQKDPEITNGRGNISKMLVESFSWKAFTPFLHLVVGQPGLPENAFSPRQCQSYPKAKLLLSPFRLIRLIVALSLFHNGPIVSSSL